MTLDDVRRNGIDKGNGRIAAKVHIVGMVTSRRQVRNEFGYFKTGVGKEGHNSGL